MSKPIRERQNRLFLEIDTFRGGRSENRLARSCICPRPSRRGTDRTSPAVNNSHPVYKTRPRYARVRSDGGLGRGRLGPRARLLTFDIRRGPPAVTDDDAAVTPATALIIVRRNNINTCR